MGYLGTNRELSDTSMGRALTIINKDVVCYVGRTHPQNSLEGYISP